MYDQFLWAQRVVELKLGPALLARSDVFPEHSDCGNDYCSSVQKLKAALQQATAPMQRLRCGTVGRKIRDDPSEDGLKNVTEVVRTELQRALLEKCGPENLPTLVHPAPPLPRTVFSNGMSLHSHFSTAPEETLFLFEEICEAETYLRHGVQLKEGDLIFDIGECSAHFKIKA